MESIYRGIYLLFGVISPLFTRFGVALLQRSSTSNIANGLVTEIDSNDIVMGHVIDTQEGISLVPCIALCVQTVSCLSVYYIISSNTCKLNSNFIPADILDPSYVPAAVHILGWDSQGLRQNCAEEYGEIQILCVNDRVIRGPDWSWGDEDNGNAGTVTRTDSMTEYGEPYWVEVLWDGGDTYWYRMGAGGGLVDLTCVCLYCICTGP